METGCNGLWGGRVLQDGYPQDMVRYMRQQDLIQCPICLRSKSHLIRSICLDDAAGLKRQGLLVGRPIGSFDLQVDRARDILINPT